MIAAVRDAREGDLDGLARTVATQPLLVRYGITAASLSQSLRGALAGGEGLLVAEADDAVAGFAWFLPTGTFGLGGYLRLIAVAGGAERQGFGSALLEEVERRTARESRFLFLLCSSYNHPARHFYARHGYREAGELPDLVKPGIDEVVVWKRLAPYSH